MENSLVALQKVGITIPPAYLLLGITCHLSHQGSPDATWELKKNVRWNKNCTVFRAVLFREVIRIAEIFHQKANQISLTNEWISKMWPIHPTEYYSALKGMKCWSWYMISLKNKWKKPSPKDHILYDSIFMKHLRVLIHSVVSDSLPPLGL